MLDLVLAEVLDLLLMEVLLQVLAEVLVEAPVEVLPSRVWVRDGAITNRGAGRRY